MVKNGKERARRLVGRSRKAEKPGLEAGKARLEAEEAGRANVVVVTPSNLNASSCWCVMVDAPDSLRCHPSGSTSCSRCPDRERHGYGIILGVVERTAVRASSALGCAPPRSPNTRRVAKTPSPTSTRDDRRRYYRLTPVGRAVLRAETARLEALVRHAHDRRVLASVAHVQSDRGHDPGVDARARRRGRCGRSFAACSPPRDVRREQGEQMSRRSATSSTRRTPAAGWRLGACSRAKPRTWSRPGDSWASRPADSTLPERLMKGTTATSLFRPTLTDLARSADPPERCGATTRLRPARRP